MDALSILVFPSIGGCFSFFSHSFSSANADFRDFYLTLQTTGGDADKRKKGLKAPLSLHPNGLIFAFSLPPLQLSTAKSLGVPHYTFLRVFYSNAPDCPSNPSSVDDFGIGDLVDIGLDFLDFLTSMYGCSSAIGEEDSSTGRGCLKGK